MKRNIYQKLHDACLSAGSVKKGAKANGCTSIHCYMMMYKQQQHKPCLDNGLYATCNYLTEIVPNYKTSNGRMYYAKFMMLMIQHNIYLLMVVQHLEILDKFGTGTCYVILKKVCVPKFIKS